MTYASIRLDIRLMKESSMLRKLLGSLILLTCTILPASGQSNSIEPRADSTTLAITSSSRDARRSITSMDLLSMRNLTNVWISPDGKSVAYSVSQGSFEVNSYVSTLFVIGVNPGGAPVSPVSLGVARDPAWSPDSQSLSYRSKASGKWQVWLWLRNSGQTYQITNNLNDVQSHDWSGDGTMVVFTPIEPTSNDDAEAKRAAEQGIVYNGTIRPWLGKPIIEAVAEHKTRKTQVWLYDVAHRIERKATLEEEAVYRRTQAPPTNDDKYAVRTKLSPDGKSIAYIAQFYDSDKFAYLGYSLFVKSLDGGKAKQLIPTSVFYIADLWWSNDGTSIYFAQVNGYQARGTLFAVPIQGGPNRAVTKTQDDLIGFSFDKERSRVACIRANSIMPPEVAVFDLRGGIPRTLTSLNPEFKSIKLSPAVWLEWTNKYGDKTAGNFVKPLNYEPGKRYPLIVTSYSSGRGFLRGGVGDEYPIQVFAANGFAVLDFNAPPRRTHKPGDFETQILDWFAPMASLETAVKLLVDMGAVDQNRTGLTGLSYGAEITEFTITHSNKFQAAVDSGSGGRDPMFYYLANDSWRKTFADWGLGFPDGGSAQRWRELSPALNALKVNAPLLIQAADSEYLGGLQFYTALKENGKPVELVIYPDEGHIKQQPKHRYYVYERNLDWFKFWLQGKEDADPEKKEQYARWNAMKTAQEIKRTEVLPQGLK